MGEKKSTPSALAQTRGEDTMGNAGEPLSDVHIHSKLISFSVGDETSVVVSLSL